MSRQTKPSPTDVAAVLDGAAAHIDTVGWHQGRMYDSGQADAGTPVEQCRVCAIGAVYAAIHGVPRAGVEGPALTLAIAAENALEGHLDGSVVAWNDEQGRTKDDVTTALRATAASLRGEAA
jgi:hypothetical protein